MTVAPSIANRTQASMRPCVYGEIVHLIYVIMCTNPTLTTTLVCLFYILLLFHCDYTEEPY